MTEERRIPKADARAGAPPDGEPLEPGEGADLLSIGLLVFFVSLLLVVAALLALPVVLG